MQQRQGKESIYNWKTEVIRGAFNGLLGLHVYAKPQQQEIEE